MADLIVSLEGTPAGQSAALGLALLAALLHAVFGALQKGRFDPWTSRTAIDAGYGLMAVPLVFLVPLPEPHLWPILAGSFVIHLGYKLAQGYTYVAGAYTVVYPVVRGTGPLFAVIGASIVFGEQFSAAQWLGVAVLLSGIFGLGVYNLIHQQVQRETLPLALGLAVLTGFFVALYTTYDAYGIRSTANPFTFLAWFFLIDGLGFALLAGIWRRRALARVEDRRALARLGLTGGLVAFGSFGAIMLATRLDNVGEAAVLRETSTVFAAAIAYLMFGERVGKRRLALMGLIAAGAVIVEFFR